GVSERIESHRIHTSSLQWLAGKVSDYRRLLPLFPRAVRGWDLSPYDAIISSSHAVAKGVDPKEKPHLCYCHTPMRYIWDRFDDYFPKSRPLLRGAVSLFTPRLRKWDVKTAADVTRFIANSNFVRDRIQKYYRRDADVIHPFAADAFFAAPLRKEREHFDLIVSALVPYKRLELALATGRRIIVIGDGPMRKRLKATAGPNVTLI